MEHVGSFEWQIGLLLGLVSVALFANERLNRLLPSEGIGGGRERLIRMLQPAMMRRPRVYFRGVLFYFGSLAALYIVVAIFGSYLGPVIGELTGLPGLTPTDPVWPVAIALTIVGLLPGISALDRIETKARAVTHRLVGVPSTFNDFADRLMAVEIKPTEIPADLLDPLEAESLRTLLERARATLGSGGDFHSLEQCSIKLWCFREWLQRSGEWPGAQVRRQFEAIEEMIRPDALAVIEDLELLPAPQAVAESERAVEHSRWRSAAERTVRVTDDVCALFALYTERAESLPVRRNPISDTLRLLIVRAAGTGRGPAPVDSILLVLLALALAAFGIGFGGAAWGILAEPDANGTQVFFASTDYVFRIAATFGPATAIALAMCHRSDWVNAFESPQPPTRQYLGFTLVVIATTAALIGSYVFFQQLSTHMELVPGRADIGCVVWQFLGIPPAAEARADCVLAIKFDPSIAPNYLPGVWYIVPLAVVAGECAVAMALVFDARAGRTSRKKIIWAIAVVQPLIATGLMAMGGVFLDLVRENAVVVAFESLAAGALTLLLFVLTAWFGGKTNSRVAQGLPDPEAMLDG